MLCALLLLPKRRLRLNQSTPPTATASRITRSRPAALINTRPLMHFSDDMKCTDVLKEWKEKYQRTGQVVRVNFARLSSSHYLKDRATHLIHWYPAKVLSQIPAFFFRALSNRGESVLDPFAGSGTVLLEARLAGRRTMAAEINPLARLITQVKITPVPSEILEREGQKLLDSIDLRRHSFKDLPEPLRFWHDRRVLYQLAAIAE